MDAADLDAEIEGTQAHVMKVTKTEAGITFAVPYKEFGPFEIMWANDAAAPETYGVTYEFVSGTESKPELPDSVNELLPTDDQTYAAGETVTAKAPSKTEVETEDGVWTFSGWDKPEAEMTAPGLTFTGTWTFSAYGADLNMIPVITAEDKTLNVGDKFDPMADVSAEDEEDGDLTEEIVIVKNDVDTSAAGSYEVTYKVTDSDGASAIKTIIVTVVDNSEPEEPGDEPGTPEEPGDEPGTPEEPGDDPGTPEEPGDKPGTPEEPGDDPGTPEEPGDDPATEKPGDKPAAEKPSVEEPADSEEAPQVAQTGDNANPVLWIVISIAAVLAIIAAAVCLYMRKHDRRNRRR